MAIASLPGSHAVQAQLDTYGRRVRRERRLRYLGLAALGVGAVWLLVAVLYYFNLASARLFLGCAVLAVLLPLLALALEVARRPSPVEVARRLDAVLDNRQRVVTAVELLNAPTRTPLTDAQLASTAALLDRVDPRRVAPERSGALFAVGAGLLGLALALFVLKGVPGSFAPIQPGRLPADQQQANALISPTPESGLPDAAQTPQAAPAAGQQGSPDGVPAPGSGKDPADAAREAAASQSAQNGLDRLAQALDQQSVTQQAADSLRQGNYDQAAQQLATVGEQNDQLSQDAKQGLADALDSAASDPSTNSTLRQAERSAAGALRNGDYKAINQAMQNLGNAVKQTGNNVVPQQQLAQDFPTPPAQDAQQGQSGGQDQANAQNGQQGQQGGQQGQDAQQGQDGSQSAGQQGSGQDGQQANAGADGASGGQDAGSGQTDGGSPGGNGAGTGSRVSGPGDRERLNATGNPFELEGRPVPGQTTSAPPGDQPHVTVNGNGDTGGGASAPSPSAPGSPVTVSGESAHPSVADWEIIQRYFNPDQK